MISKRAETYGKAFFEISSSKAVLQSLKSFSEALNEKESLEFFNSFVISLEDKKKALQASFKNEGEEIERFLFVLLENRALPLLPEIVQAYEKLLFEQQSCERGWVCSANPLSPQEKKELEHALGKFLNKKIDLEERTDKKTIAGFFVQVGDYVFNDTLQGHLNTFKKLGGS